MWIKILLTLLLSLPTAWGYNLTQDFKNGFYWSSLPIGISVIDASPARKTKIENLTKKAIKEWESLSDRNLWDETNTTTSNIIRWSDNFAAETGMDAASVLAIAIRYTGGPYFAKTEIVINGNHILNQNDIYLETTILHELGHTMGLDHSGDWDAIMAPTLKQTPEVEYDDVLGMREAYRQMLQRQTTGYVSPLSYQKEETSSQPLSCATVAVSTSTPASGMISLGLGILIGFVRKAFGWLKRLF